jgi:hypothetical protein
MTAAYVGIDVCCAKNKPLPVVVCARDGKKFPMLELGRFDEKPPRGGGNLRVIDTEWCRGFARLTVSYLQAVERKYEVVIHRIAIDAPRAPRSGLTKRECERALSSIPISYFETPSSEEFETIIHLAHEHTRQGRPLTRIPFANKLWMLVGFELFHTLRKHWECLEVFPQATVRAIGAGDTHKSKAEGYACQLAAASKFTRASISQLEARLKICSFGSRHDRLDAYLCAWVAALEPDEREPYGVPPEDAIWIPRVRKA